MFRAGRVYLRKTWLPWLVLLSAVKSTSDAVSSVLSQKQIYPRITSDRGGKADIDSPQIMLQANIAS